jgi:NADH-quinone oxidoreductase subunit L
VLATLNIFIFYTLPGLNPFSASSGWYAYLVQQPISAVSSFLGYNINAISDHTEHAAHLTAMILSIFLASFGIVLAFSIYFWKKFDVEKLTVKMGFLYNLSYNKYYFDEIYQATFVNGLLLWNRMLSWFDNAIIDGLVNLSAWLTRNFSFLSGKFDNGVIDGIVNEIANLTQDSGKYLRKIQTGQIQTYIYAALLGAVIIIVINII